MTFRFTTTIFNDGILTREDKWFETITVYTTKQKDRFPPPSALAAAEQHIWSEACSQVLLTPHPAAADQGCTHLCTHLCSQILGARLLLFQPKWYKGRTKNRSEQQTAIIANFCPKCHNHISAELLNKVFLKHFFIYWFIFYRS